MYKIEKKSENNLRTINLTHDIKILYSFKIQKITYNIKKTTPTIFHYYNSFGQI